MFIFRGVPHPQGYSSWEGNNQRTRYRLTGPRPDTARIGIANADSPLLEGWFASRLNELHDCDLVGEIPDELCVEGHTQGGPTVVAIIYLMEGAETFLKRPLVPVRAIYQINSQYPHREIE